MNRLYAVEAAYSLTGAMADHACESQSVDSGGRSSARDRVTPAPSHRRFRASTRGGSTPRPDLWRTAGAADRRRSSQPPAVHAAVKLKRRARQRRATVTYHETLDAALPSRASLTEPYPR
jgi:hypothetical protein